MAQLDVFNSAAFVTRSLTTAVNIRGNVHGNLNNMGLFRDVPETNKLIAVERKTYSLVILPSVEWGGPPTKGGKSTRELIPLTIPHIPVEDRILAADVQGIRAFGQESETESVMDLINEKMEALNQNLDVTLEYMKWGLLNGTVLDGGGKTLLDLFTAMSVTQEAQSITLSSDSTNIEQAVVNIKRYYEENARGLPYTGIHVFCSNGWYDAFKAHPNVEKIYNVYINNGRALGEDYRNRFEAWGVVFENVAGSWTNMAGSTVYQVPTDEAIAIPTGADIFTVHNAPADFIETVNTRGLPRYAKQAVDAKYNRYVDVLVEANPLPFCTRPDMIVSLTKA